MIISIFSFDLLDLLDLVRYIWLKRDSFLVRIGLLNELCIFVIFCKWCIRWEWERCILGYIDNCRPEGGSEMSQILEAQFPRCFASSLYCRTEGTTLKGYSLESILGSKSHCFAIRFIIAIFIYKLPMYCRYITIYLWHKI